MKHHTAFAPFLGLLACLFGATPAGAALFTVSQGGTTLGTVDGYTGTLSSVANFGYVIPSRNVTNGPSPVASELQLFFYEGSDGLSFNIGLSGGGSAAILSEVHWDILIEGSTTDPGVLAVDDAITNELVEDPVTNNLFLGRWYYNQSYGDGGVIGVLSGDWRITITPVLYTNVTDLVVYGAGSSLNLAIDPTQEIVLAPLGATAVPGAPVWGLLAAGFPLLWSTRRLARAA